MLNVIRQVSRFSMKIDQQIIRIKVVFPVRQSRVEVAQVESKQERILKQIAAAYRK